MVNALQMTQPKNHARCCDLPDANVGVDDIEYPQWNNIERSSCALREEDIAKRSAVGRAERWDNEVRERLGEVGEDSAVHSSLV